MKYFLYICCFLLLLSCDNSIKPNLVDNFPESVHLKNQKIKTPPILYQVVGMEILDDALVVLDFNSDYFFKFFDLNNFNFLGKKVAKGRGPDEEVTVFPYFKKMSDNQIMYKSLTAIKIMKYVSKDSTLELKKKISLPSKLLNLTHVFELNNKYYGWEMPQKGSKEFIGFDPETLKSFEFGPEYPIVDYGIPSDEKTSHFDRIIAVKPDMSKFATLYNKFPIIRISSNQGELLHESKFMNGQVSPEMILHNPSKKDYDNIIQNYKKVKTTNKYIYGLYCGKSNEDMNVTNEVTGLFDYAKEIHVWDWEGKPVKRIYLDKECFSFCVSPDDSFIITSSIGDLDELNLYQND